MCIACKHLFCRWSRGWCGKDWTNNDMAVRGTEVPKLWCGVHWCCRVDVHIKGSTNACLCIVCMQVCMLMNRRVDACMYTGVYVHMYVCTHVCMYVCMYVNGWEGILSLHVLAENSPGESFSQIVILERRMPQGIGCMFESLQYNHICGGWPIAF